MIHDAPKAAEVGRSITVDLRNTPTGGRGGEAVVRLGPRLRELPGRCIVEEGTWGDIRLALKRYSSGLNRRKHALREWHNLNRLRELGLAVEEPLFMGALQDGSLVVATSLLEGATGLRSQLSARSSGCQGDFDRLLLTVADQHTAGTFQKDSHLNNYLVSQGSIVALDASSFLFRAAPLSLRLRVKNLAALFAHVDVLREEQLWNSLGAYINRCGVDFPGAALRAALTPAVRTARRRRLRGFLRKTIRPGSPFGRIRRDGLTLFYDRSAPVSLINRMMSEPDALVGSGSPVKLGDTTTLCEFELEGAQYVVKRYNRKPLRHRVRRCLSPSRARRSWSNGLALLEFGLLTPRPVAVLELGRGAWRQRSYLVMEKCPGRSLEQHVHDQGMAHRRVVENLHQIWGAMGKLSATHGDMKATNFIISDEDAIYVLDLDSFCFFAPPLLYRLRREKDRKRFMKNWQQYPAAAKAFRATIGSA